MPPSPELALAAEQLTYLLDHADELPDEGAAYFGRVLRDLFDEIRSVADRLGGLSQLIERRRLLAAYRLLCDLVEVASVSSTAWRCGFGDLSRFSRRFRETFQASPSDLRHFRRERLPTWAGAYHVERNYRGMIAG